MILGETYEAGVKSSSAPPSNGGRVGLVVVVEIPAWVEFATGLDEVDEAVGGGLGDELDEHAEGGEARLCRTHSVYLLESRLSVTREFEQVHSKYQSSDIKAFALTDLFWREPLLTNELPCSVVNQIGVRSTAGDERLRPCCNRHVADSSLPWVSCHPRVGREFRTLTDGGQASVQDRMERSIGPLS